MLMKHLCKILIMKITISNDKVVHEYLAAVEPPLTELEMGKAVHKHHAAEVVDHWNI